MLFTKYIYLLLNHLFVFLLNIFSLAIFLFVSMCLLHEKLLISLLYLRHHINSYMLSNYSKHYRHIVLQQIMFYLFLSHLFDNNSHYRMSQITIQDSTLLIVKYLFLNSKILYIVSLLLLFHFVKYYQKHWHQSNFNLALNYCPFQFLLINHLLVSLLLQDIISYYQNFLNFKLFVLLISGHLY